MLFTPFYDPSYKWDLWLGGGLGQGLGLDNFILLVIYLFVYVQTLHLQSIQFQYKPLKSNITPITVEINEENTFHCRYFSVLFQISWKQFKGKFYLISKVDLWTTEVEAFSVSLNIIEFVGFEAHKGMVSLWSSEDKLMLSHNHIHVEICEAIWMDDFHKIKWRMYIVFGFHKVSITYKFHDPEGDKGVTNQITEHGKSLLDSV